MALAGLLAFPIRTGKLRLLIVVLLATCWLGFVALMWLQRRRGIAMGCLAMGSALAGWIVWGRGNAIPDDELRRLYISRLKRYDGVVYVYGGENSLGIDCSGLVRRALVDSLFVIGVRHANPAALRDAISLWWHDASAIELGKGAGLSTIPQHKDGKPLQPLGANSDVQPGDLAVTGAGSHVLAYLGGGEWIEAEPGVGRTHVFTLTGEFAPLAGEPVRFVRWRWLQNPEK